MVDYRVHKRPKKSRPAHRKVTGRVPKSEGWNFHISVLKGLTLGTKVEVQAEQGGYTAGGYDPPEMGDVNPGIPGAHI